MIKIDDAPKMWVYHEKDCKDGKIINAEDADLYLSDGWVKTPNDFRIKAARGRKPKDSGNDVSHETKGAIFLPSSEWPLFCFGLLLGWAFSVLCTYQLRRGLIIRV